MTKRMTLAIAGVAVLAVACQSTRNNPKMSEPEEITAEAREEAAPIVAEIDPTDERTNTAGEEEMHEAEITSIDREKREITLRLEEKGEEGDIALQGGRELTVSFEDLSRLTGIAEDEAVDQLHEGEEVEVQLDAFGNVSKIDAGWEDMVFPRENGE